MLPPSVPANMDVGFVLVCAALVFLMQAGFCMLESGMIRAKNSINVAVKNLLDFGISMLVFSAFGFSLMFGVTNSGWFGSHIDFWSSNDIGAFFLYQMVFCGTAATIVSGAVAERTRLSTYLFVVFVLSGFIYPLFGHWCWGGALGNTGQGWLAQLGFADWAGASVVHVVGGFASLAAIIAIGPRRNYKRSKLTGGHSLTLAIMGCFLLWFGWWGFNGGSGLSTDGNVSLVILNTNLGAVAGLMAAAVWSWKRTKKTDVVDLISGSLAGLVSVTGACNVISPIASLVAGGVGALIALGTIELLKKRGVDDAVGAFGIHGAAGIWGTLVLAIFATESALPTGTRITQLIVQATGAVVGAGFSFVSVFVALRLLSTQTHLRVRAGDEKLGLNVVEHGATNEVTDLLGAMHMHRHSGDYSERLESDTDTEVGQIAREYNAVISRVDDEVQQHRTTNTVLESEKLRLQSVLEHAGVGIYQLNEAGRFLSANTTLLETFGYVSSAFLIEQTEPFAIPWHDNNRDNKARLSECFAQGRATKNLETEFVDGNGNERWLLESIVPVRDSNGCLICWLGTVNDVTQRKQAMLAQVEIAEAKSAAKGEFLANMSHEIRTPLNGVVGMLDLLASSELERKDENYVSVARSSADSLLALINDVLDFSKIEAGKLELEHVDFDLRELMESTAEQFAIRAHIKGLEMNCNLSSDLPYLVKGDPERLRQAIINLLGNAIKFTDSGEINLCVSRRGSVVHFSVRDTGIGISEDAKSTLFESFVQADVSTTRRYGGTGLGLSIVNRLVQLMGGNLKVDSEIGMGANFWFELALPVTAEETPADVDTGRLLAGLSQCNILVVDDNATNCEILQNQLEGWGLNCSICNRSTSVVQKLLVSERLERPVDLIILDFCMPEMNGRDVALDLQTHATLSQIPIIMLSSNHELLSQRELEEAGIDVAITKPARQSRLFDSIVTLLYQRNRKQTAIQEKHIANSPLPNSPQQASLNPADDDHSKNNSITKDVLTAKNPKPAVTSSDPEHSDPETLKNCVADVLIAEDNEVNQIVAQQMLSTLGYSSEVVADGSAAVERLARGNYGLILMDGHMPIMDGLTACRKIREHEASQGRSDLGNGAVPIIALTANVVSGIRQQCIDAGMNDYLSKPLTLARLEEVALRYLGKPQAEPSATESQSNDATQAGSDVLMSLPTLPVADTPVEEIVDKPKLRPRRIHEDTIIDVKDIFDHEALTFRCGGNTDVEQQVLSIMQETLPSRAMELRKAVEAEDTERVRAIAHQLKGAAGDTSLIAIQSAAASLEQHACNEERDLMSADLAELESRINATLNYLQRLFSDQVTGERRDDEVK